MFRAIAPAWESVLGEGWLLLQRLVEALRDTHRDKRDENEGRDKRDGDDEPDPRSGEELSQDDLREFIKAVSVTINSSVK